VLRERRSDLLNTGIGRVEIAIYLVVAGLLIAAAGFTLVGTVVDVIRGSKSRQVTDTGVFLLDRVLLIFIIAELLYTLRLVNLGGRILVEPFLLIGLIAVVRKVLVITAEFTTTRRAAVDFVIQIGALSALALVLVLAIYILRRSSPEAASAVPNPRP
jgi:uncharacterized membrane protein (DUF373 family)